MSYSMMTRSASAPVLNVLGGPCDRESFCSSNSPSLHSQCGQRLSNVALGSLGHGGPACGKAMNGDGRCGSSMQDGSPRLSGVRASSSFWSPSPFYEKRNPGDNLSGSYGSGFFRRIRSDSDIGPSDFHQWHNQKPFDETDGTEAPSSSPPWSTSNTPGAEDCWPSQLASSSLLRSSVQGFESSHPRLPGMQSQVTFTSPSCPAPAANTSLSLPGLSDTLPELSQCNSHDQRHHRGIDLQPITTSARVSRSVASCALEGIGEEFEEIGPAQTVDDDVLLVPPMFAQAMDARISPHPEVMSDGYRADSEWTLRPACVDDVAESEAQRNCDETEAYYKRAMDADPENTMIMRNFARFLLQVKEDYRGAEVCLERAILACPTDADVLVQYAKLLWDVHHDADRAVTYFERAVQAAPEDCYVLAAYASFLWRVEAAAANIDMAPGDDGSSRTNIPLPTPA